MKYKLI